MNETKFLLPPNELPNWVEYPNGLKLLVSRGTVDFVVWRFPEASWALQTYSHLKERYDRELFPLAWRVGTDDCACIERDSGEAMKIINGYTSKGHETETEFPSFWGWFRYAIEGMIELRGDDAA